MCELCTDECLYRVKFTSNELKTLNAPILSDEDKFKQGSGYCSLDINETVLIEGDTCISPSDKLLLNS